MDNFIEKQFFPFLAVYINSSDNELALEALKAAKGLVNYYPMDDLTQPLTSALQHKNKDVAYLALDVLRMKREKVGSIAPAEYKKLVLETVVPFMFACFGSRTDEVVLNAMNVVNVLNKDAELEEVLFNPLEKLLQHKNKQIAHLALDIIRVLSVRKEINIFEGV